MRSKLKYWFKLQKINLGITESIPNYGFVIVGENLNGIKNMVLIKPLILDQEDNTLHSAALAIWRSTSVTVPYFLSQKLGNEVQITHACAASWLKYNYLGPRCSVWRVYPNEELTTLVGNRLPDPAFDAAVTEGYDEVAWTGKPVRHYVQGKTNNFWVAYERIILPVTFADGKPAFAVFTSLIRRLSVVDLSGRS